MIQEFKFGKEKEEFEQKVFQMNKLNALGLQISGIAHEFNNILGVIPGYLEIIKKELKGSQVLDVLKVIEKQERVTFKQGAHILMIDDEEMILDMMRVVLESRGHRVSVSKDSDIGLKMYESNLYDIVLCDLAMPKFNGWKVAKYIKEYDAVRKKAKTTVVLITGSELSIESVDYRKEGVDFILHKPIEYEKLYQIINYTIAGSQKDVSVDS